MGGGHNVYWFSNSAPWPIQTVAEVSRFPSIKYKVERNERYPPYIELGRWLCSHFQLETRLNSKTIQRRATNLTSLDSLGSCESICV